MWLVLKILVGLALVWWWLLSGSRSHCPSCGRSLRIGDGIIDTRLRDWCPCGWHRDV